MPLNRNATGPARPLIVGLVIGFVLWTSGCDFLRVLMANAFQEPKLTFRDVQISDVTLGGATVNLHYQIENPNPLGISLAETAYTFFVEGKQVASGSPPQGLTIPPSGKADLTFPASVKFLDLVPALEDLLTKDHANYRAEGRIGVQTPVGIVRIPLAKEGQLDLPKVPAFRVEPPRLSAPSFFGASLDVPITVTNRCKYELPIGALTGALKVAGVDLATVASEDLGRVGAFSSRQIVLPVKVGLAQIPALTEALASGQSTVELDGRFGSGPISFPLHLVQNVPLTRGL